MTEILREFDLNTSPFPERSVLNYKDWRKFVSMPEPMRPQMLTWESYKALSSFKRWEFNQSREFYHAKSGPLEVAAMQKIHATALRLASQNLSAQPGARPGIIIDGLGTVGKSTIVMQLGRRYERQITRNFQITVTPSGHTFIPVVYVSLPGEVNIMNFNHILARFYNIPFPKSAKEYFLTDRIKEHAADCGTSLFIVDDIHFLKIKNRSHETLNNHLKNLANDISATFVYAGINCRGTGLLTEGKSMEEAKFSQTSHRFKKFDVKPYDFTEEGSRSEFFRVLSTIESNLILFRHQPGTLANDLGKYIYTRTNGFLGAIATLIKEAAINAIKLEVEQITKEILEDTKLDDHSEETLKLVKKIPTTE